MAYFNHAFHKVFLATNATDAYVTTGNARALLPAQVGFYAAPNKGVTNNATPDALVVPGTNDCPLVLAQGSIYASDKIGPFHGGYRETSKSKIINPKYVTGFWRVNACGIRQESISIGDTFDDTTTPNISPCVDDFAFKCGETYYLRVDLKGAPNLRYLSRNNYLTASAYTGCCADPNSPTDVNPLIVYINWAYQLLNSPLTSPFIRIKIQYGANGATTLNPAGLVTANWFTSAAADLALLNAYITTPSTIPAATISGFIIQGAYVDTQFGDCTFYPNDALQAYLEPVKLYASMVDYNGDPCAFTGVCVRNSCLGRQGMGYGESIVRRLILSEGYAQSPFYTGRDLRIREITQGYNVTDAIDRGLATTAQYDSVFIQHSVPRFNNPTGTFDNDQYLLEIVFPTGSADATTFCTNVGTWISDNGGACILEAGSAEVYACEANSAICGNAALS
jgi:hypothetical protein